MTRFLSLLAAVIVTAAPVNAQSTPFAPAIIVNEDMITYYDLAQRRALYRAYGLDGDLLDDRVVEDLTEEALMRQEADRLGIDIGNAQISAAFESYTAARDASPEGFTAALRRGGIDVDTVMQQIDAQLGWQQAMQARFRSRAIPDQTDLEEAVLLNATGTTREVLLAEIAIPFAERGEARTRELIVELAAELQAGGDFAAAARQYSRTPTRSNGGEIGWIAVTDLPPAMRAEVDLIDIGGVSRPIPITRGVSLLAVNGERQIAAQDNDTVTLTYARATFPLSLGEEAARTAALAARREIQTCSDVEAGSFGEGSGTVGPVTLAGISPALFSVIATAQTGSVSQPIRTGDSLSIIVICSRNVELDEETRRVVQDQIFANRIGAYADGYMQELLRDAIVETR
ncbi:peptidyl-prolyl cis-trans isomerase SurA [Monaibacterium marinum]|uniref:Parvulin-like PPIase n=1 Tax=Pontivivens marinum TaxID=1690039 RepID=A0A2C9CQ47_9RHOB|nr:peptidylprolyl isomerase [Monaibacterium marinum]SOH93661.1 peptidyl-prolyl cis-trans isomerase SurA [Monaibacterium marinum]